MKRLCLAVAFSLIAGIAPLANAADTPPAPVTHPVSIGGGVRKPWTPPYVLALLNVSNVAAIGTIGLASILVLLRSRNRDYH